jgi:hypothetical protein
VAPPVVVESPVVDEWVGEIVFDPANEAKLRQRKGITAEEVRDAVAYGGHESARWDDDPDYGPRLVLTGSSNGRRLRAYLRPLDRADGRWECLTAWRI